MDRLYVQKTMRRKNEVVIVEMVMVGISGLPSPKLRSFGGVSRCLECLTGIICIFWIRAFI